MRAALIRITRWLACCALLCAALTAPSLLAEESASGNDLAAEAASGRLWRSSVAQLSEGVLRQAQFRLVDNTTLRLRRDAHLGFGGIITGDVEIRFGVEEVRPQLLSTTVYNKGDNGELSKAEFEALLANSLEKLNALLQVEPQQRKTSKKETGVRLRAWVWEAPNCAALLEASSIGSGKKFSSEFIRLTIAPTKEALERGGAEDAVKRADLKMHVKKLEDGTTIYIDGIPMVDQGEKGYCVPATLSRVFAYYGMDGVDQHALAALCRSTGESGTTLEGMEKALKSISGAFHVSVVPMKWLGEKEMERLATRIIQKERVPVEMLPNALFKYLKNKPAPMAKGFKEIKKQIDAGIPVVWAVLLGMFQEQGLPQSSGGHMRLIIGYNEERKAIIYSDTWGHGHEMKAMPIEQACIITQALYVLRPRR